RLDDLLFVGDIDPTSLAAEVARVDDGDVEERGKELAALDPGLVPLDGEGTLYAHIPGELPQEAFVSLEDQALGQVEHHWCISRSTVRVECRNRRSAANRLRPPAVDAKRRAMFACPCRLTDSLILAVLPGCPRLRRVQQQIEHLVLG